LSAAAGRAEPRRAARFSIGTWFVVAALVLGLVLGGASERLVPAWRDGFGNVFGIVGGLWLDALRVTVIPLVFALLVKGIVGGTSVAGEGRIAARAVLWFAGLYISSATIGMIVTPLLLDLFPLSPGSAQAVQAGFAAVDPASVKTSVAGLGDFIRSFIPSNLFAAAAIGSILQIVVFAIAFAAAISLLEPARRKPLTAFFDSLGEVMLIIIGWVLKLAPAGVFALAFVAGAASGAGLFGAMLHFIILYIAVGLIIIVAAYAVAVIAAGFPLGAFARALAPTQAIAFSTQSSTGSLPAMLLSAKRLGIQERTADIALPMAAALFRATGPAMNVAVAVFIARMLGMELTWGAMLAGVAVGAVASISAPGLPGQVSYFTSIAPIAMAMGVPIAPLGMLIAIEPVPDMFRTVGNVTMDVAVAGALDRRSG